MKCELCGKNTRCSCKWGGCPWCNSTNKQVSFMNDLLKFWLSKEVLRENYKTIRTYIDKIDTFTAYEYYTNQITEEQFNEALDKFKPTRKKILAQQKKSEIIDVSNRVNPWKEHKWNWTSPRSRCEYCWCIKKYCEKEECKAYKWEETPVTTDTENK